MCGRATVINPDGITEKLYGYTKKFVPSDWKPRYNLNPREEIPAVYYDPFLRQRVLRTMHWNFIPSKLANRERVDEFDSHYSAFNARIETVASAQTFEQAWRSQRCLVVIDGIIEWVGEKRHKIPHLIRPRPRAVCDGRTMESLARPQNERRGVVVHRHRQRRRRLVRAPPRSDGGAARSRIL